MPAKREVRCTGTRKNRNGDIIPCTRIIAEIEYVNDARLLIKCGSCGTMNIIEANQTREQVRGTLKELGRFPITKISV